MTDHRAIAGFAVCLCLAGGGAPRPSHGAETTALLTARPFARPMQDAASVRPLAVEMRAHESLPAALLRAGLDAGEAERATAALADDFDTVNPHPGLTLQLGVTPSGSGSSHLRLASLELTPRDDERLGLFREADGALHLRRVQSPVFTAPSLTRGVVKGSLYLSIVEAGVSPDQAAKVVGLFGRRLDLARDIESGDRFRLVFEQRRRSTGEVLDAGELLYAEIVTRDRRARLYRYQPPGSTKAEWVDGDSGPRVRGLLRTPVDGARLTSGFGMRLHPLLGFTRMHQGVDFGAPVGAPVLAAGDGVVEEARWDGGYGRWLKIRHGPGLETGYAHLSGWASGVSPGASVRQGQVVAYVGQTGLATGPHLHFEVFKEGQRIDPRAAPQVTLASRDPALDPDFRARRAIVDAAVASIAAACAVPSLFPPGQAPHCVG
ncbi:MAG TPA: M23 family metallopeptidase [Caulobacteraceae bacterium]|nr:M23 family metallopeptidase [Caulobacteraceae bacterium]